MTEKTKLFESVVQVISTVPNTRAAQEAIAAFARELMRRSLDEGERNG